MATILRIDRRSGEWKQGQGEEVTAKISAAGEGLWAINVTIKVVGSSQILEFGIIS